MAKYEVHYDEFKDLWLRDDPEWIKQRKHLWKRVKVNMEQYYNRSLGDANYKQQLTHYFVYGELLRYADQIVSNFISCSNRLLCVPWSNREELERVFNYRVHSAENRAEMMTFFPIASSHYFQGIPEEWPRIRLFCEVLLGDEYKEIESPNLPGSNQLRVISPKPSYLIESYIRCAVDLLQKSNDNNFTWLNCSFAYFLSCIDYVDEHEIGINEIYLKRLFKVFKEIDTKTPKYGQYQREVFEKLYSYMMADDAPHFIVGVREKIIT